jgi:two-component system NarL family sensor kinase
MGWTGRSSASVAVPVAQFAASGLATVALLGFGAVAILQHTGSREAIRSAQELTQLAGQGIVGPNITAGLLSGNPRELARMDRIVRAFVLRDATVRVKIWTSQGRIVYSDEPRLIGSTYPLRQDELTALRTGIVDAEISDLTRAENRFERPQKKLLEVYLPLRTPGGQKVLYEEYLRFSSVAASERRQWSAFLPALVGALVLLWLAQVPLAWSLARRLRQRQREREALLQRTIDASEIERRRIAAYLHDGVVQNLAGVSYALTAAADRAGPGPVDGLQPSLYAAAAQTRESIRELRTLLVEIYPPSLESAGLDAAIHDLVAPLRARGIDVTLELPPGLKLTTETEAVLFRGAQEALRNVAKHADAQTAHVLVALHNGTARLTVSDDGRGFATTRGQDEPADGHLGLRLLEDMVHDAGGQFTVDSKPGEGTRVVIEVPVG